MTNLDVWRWIMKKKHKSKPVAKPDLPHYYICSDCAQARGGRWPEVHCATSHAGNCPYCNTKQTLVSITDWLWGDDKKLKFWD